MSTPAISRSAPRGSLAVSLYTLFTLTLRQQVRGKRLLVMGFLFLIPAGLGILLRSLTPPPTADDLELALLMALFPHVLVPLAALLAGTSMIQDEIEEQTLTYLLMRPIPRWLLYLTRLLATWCLTAALTTVFTLLTCAVIYWGEPDFVSTMLTGTAMKMVVLHLMTLATYCTLFGAISLHTRRSLILGIGYIILFEGLLANVDFIIRRLTVVFYYRVLIERWVGRVVRDWELTLTEVPSSFGCVLTLLGVALLAALWGARVFSRTEFRVKTPEGS